MFYGETRQILDLQNPSIRTPIKTPNCIKIIYESN